MIAAMKADPVKKRYYYRRAALQRYGMSLEDYDAMFLAQGGVCKSCGDPPLVVVKEGVPPVLCVDHNHTTKKNRSLLCSPCNISWGHLDESSARILKLMDYLMWTLSTPPSNIPYGRNGQGVAIEAWKKLTFQLQKGLCKACKGLPTPQGCKSNKVLGVDHSHKTGFVRSLLCRGCNCAFGHMMEDMGRLSKLLAYSLWSSS